MNNKITLWLSAAALACASSAAYATPTPASDASLFVWDSAGDTGVGVQDNVGVDFKTEVGVVGWSGTIGSWNLNTDVGTTKPQQGSATTPDMDIFFSAQTTSAGTINIAFFDDGFGPVNGSALMKIGGTTIPGATVTYTTYTRAGGAAPGFGGTSYNPTGSGWTKLGSTGSLTDAFSDKFTGGLLSGGANPFELLQVITISVSNPGSVTTGDATLTAPDGGMTLMLLGSSLTALAFIRRSFKKA